MCHFFDGFLRQFFDQNPFKFNLSLSLNFRCQGYKTAKVIVYFGSKFDPLYSHFEKTVLKKIFSDELSSFRVEKSSKSSPLDRFFLSILGHAKNG